MQVKLQEMRTVFMEGPVTLQHIPDTSGDRLWRLNDLVGAIGGPSAAARELGVARNTVDMWLKGRSRIPLDAAADLAARAGRSLDWVVSGEQAVQVRASSDPVPEGFVPLPVLRVEAGAGGGRYPVPADLAEGDTVAFREVWLRSLGLYPGKAHILWASGDSMDPTIRHGDMMIVDRMIDSVVDDGIYVVVVGGAVMVKRIQVLHNGSVALKSDNPRYAEQTVPADEVPQLIVEGRVRWVGGPI